MSMYASDGYLVLMPDIVYTVGTPGSNALDCVEAAVRYLLPRKKIQRKKMIFAGGIFDYPIGRSKELYSVTG